MWFNLFKHIFLEDKIEFINLNICLNEHFHKYSLIIWIRFINGQNTHLTFVDESKRQFKRAKTLLSSFLKIFCTEKHNVWDFNED